MTTTTTTKLCLGCFEGFCDHEIISAGRRFARLLAMRIWPCSPLCSGLNCICEEVIRVQRAAEYVAHCERISVPAPEETVEFLADYCLD